MSQAGVKLQVLLPALAGALLAIGLPGKLGLWPLLFVGLVPLFLAIHRSSSLKQAALSGFLFGMSHYLLVLYWIVIVLGKYGGLPLFLSLPALFLLAGYMSLYPLFFGLVIKRAFHSTGPLATLLLVPALWVGLDWLRSILFTGFPWMDLGYGFFEVTPLIQIADLVGHYGVTFVVVLLNAMIFLYWVNRQKPADLLWPVVLTGVTFALVVCYSTFRLQTVEKNMARQQPARIGIVQGNISQDQKWSEEFKQETIQRYVSLTKKIDHQESLKMVVWPETAVPFYPHTSFHFREVVFLQKQSGIPLLFGAPWYEKTSGEEETLYFNAALLIDKNSKLLGKYYKSHLVPYGEYVPLKKIMPFLAPLVESVGDFTPGTIGSPLTSGDIKAGILLCYESIFPAISRQWSKNGANILVNLTNDAWYGKSSAPYQSFAMSVFRAVETRKTVVRSANTGISGVVDQRGKIVGRSDIFIPWSMGYEVHLNAMPTFFVTWGSFFAPLCLLIGLVFPWFRWKKEKK